MADLSVDMLAERAGMSSRNFAHGVRMGRGEAADHRLAEGVATAPALVARGRREGVELPVAEAVADVLAGTLAPRDAAARLLARPMRME